MVLTLGGWYIKDPWCEHNYNPVDLDFMDGGGQDGAFNASREAWEFGLKHLLG